MSGQASLLSDGNDATHLLLPVFSDFFFLKAFRVAPSYSWKVSLAGSYFKHRMMLTDELMPSDAHA